MSRPIRISACCKGLAAVLLILLSGRPLGAQETVQRDSSAFRPRELIAPGVLMTSGLAIRCFAHETFDVKVQEAAQQWRARSGEVPYYNVVFKYIPALPLVMDAGLGLLGVPAEHSFLDRGIEGVLALGIVSGTALAMKGVIDTPRPDSRDNDAFPSGHCCVAFVGAELVRLEYGWGWGAGAYAVATTVAVLRIYHNRHWLSDLLMGAGMGILSAHAGRWLLEPVKDLFQIPDTTWGNGRPAVQAALVPGYDPVSGAFCAGLALNF